MIRGVLFGGLMGGIVLFVWGFISWQLLPWHNATIGKFTDEKAVADAITANATEPGVYHIPADPEDMTTGPIILATLRTKGMSAAMIPELIVQFVIQFLSAAVVSLMVRQLRDRYYPTRLALIMLFGLGVGLACQLPYWNWFGFSIAYTGVQIADSVIAWTLAGVVIARVAVVPPKK